MSDTVKEKDSSAPDPQIKDEDVTQATETIKKAQATRGTDGDIVEFSDILTTFVYVLLRDYLPAGQVENAVKAVIGGETVIFTDSFLAQYADSLANTLKDAKIGALANALEKAFTEKVKQPCSPPHVTKKSEAHFGDSDEFLQNLQQRVDEAIDSMDEEDEVLEENPLDEVSRNDEIGLVANDYRPSSVEKEVRKRLQNAEWRNSPEKVDESSGDDIDVVPEATESQYSKEITSSLEAIDSLKELLPTDTIKQVADILKQEIEAELVEEEVEEVEVLTREGVLQKQSEMIEEHRATNPEAAKMAERYIKEQLEDKDPKEVEGPTISRGNLKNVSQGNAFPEALDKVFEDDPEAELEKAKEVKKQMDELRSSAANKDSHPGAFQRVE